MRILIFSNYFPPYARGGYEQWCAEVAIELKCRGHEVQVVTARESGDFSSTYHGLQVHRVLNLEAKEGTWETAHRFFFKSKALARENLTHIKDLIAQTKPDVAFIWGMWNVPRSVPALVEQTLRDRVAYYFCDYWPTLPSAYEQYWSTPSDHRMVKPIKDFLGRFALRELEKEPLPTLCWNICYCVSESVCQQLLQNGIAMRRAKVIYGGTQVEQFEAAVRNWRTRSPEAPLNLLYVGRLTPDKGVHTLIQGVGRLRRGEIGLTICGDDRSAYGKQLKILAEEQGLGEYVIFMGSMPRSEIPLIMAQHDVLVFPSIWEEPFARTVIEGMAAGLIVVGTNTGGTKEILVENETGLVFPAGDAEVLSIQLQRLLNDTHLCYRLRDAGRQLIKNSFRFDQMVDKLETELELLDSRGPE